MTEANTSSATAPSTPAHTTQQSYFAGMATVPNAFIEALKANQAITAADFAVGAAVAPGASGFIALPDDFTTHDLEKLLPNRRRARGNMTSAYVQPFADYATSYAGPGAAVFVDASEMKAKAVLDLGTKESPGHAENIATLAPAKTAAYAALLAINGRAQSQQALAEFFEDWSGLVKLIFHNEGGEIPAGKALAAVRRITIESARKVDSEEKQLSANRTAFESVQATSQEPLPTTTLFTCQPYPDLAERTFALRLSILTTGNTPQLVLRIQNLEAHTEAMGNELAGLVSAAIGGKLPVLLGSYAKAQ